MRRKFSNSLAVLTPILALLTSISAYGQSADDAAKELANPNTALSSFNFKNTYRQFSGDLPGADDEDGFVTLIQPILPFPIDDTRKIIFRPAIPLVANQPVFDGFNSGIDGTQPVFVRAPTVGGLAAGFDSESGLGDIGFDLLYATTSPTGVLSGVGIIGTLPTATEDALGKDKWSAGPELFLGKVGEKSVIGALVGHQWDFAGNDDIVEDISLTTFNIFAVYLPGGGWNYGSSPIITHDSESDQWTVPLNFNVGKTVVLGERPWKFNLGFNYFVEQADEFAPDWSIDFTITPVVENVLANWFR
jgi:hypothetical protein